MSDLGDKIVLYVCIFSLGFVTGMLIFEQVPI